MNRLSLVWLTAVLLAGARAGTPERAKRRFRGLHLMHAAGIVIALAGGYLVMSG